jgi:hypothetical protein
MLEGSSPYAGERSELNRALLESVEAVLCEVLGKSTCQRILLHLTQNKGFELAEIGSRLEEFHSALNEIMGPSASDLESLVIECVSSKIRPELTSSMTPNFVNHMNSIQERYQA